jgi:hypothetical protein
MVRFYGEVGYAQSVESSPGVAEDVITERNLYGDVLQNSRRFEEQQDTVNDDLRLSNSVSVLADEFALNNAENIRYVKLNGTRWKVQSLQVAHPRIILRLGGVYNGPIPAGSS